MGWRRGTAPREGTIPQNAQAPAPAAELSTAHEALRADASIQLTLQPAPPPKENPTWLRDFVEWLGDVLAPIGRFFHWIGSFLPDAPYGRIIMWTVLAVAAAGLLWMLYERLNEGEWRLPRWRRRGAPAVEAPEEEWAPEAAPVRSWLSEADALAAQGRYADAVHHLLLRSVEDIGRRRPGSVRPALTSRELARAEAVPRPARTLFASIAALVERSLFGARPVARDDWESARSAYADLTLPKSWRA